MSNPNNAGEKRGDAGGAGKGGSNRRRYFRRRKPSATAPKTQEAAPKPETRKPQEQPAAKGRPRNNPKADVANRNDRDKSDRDKSDRDRRGGRRRRRRSRSDRVEAQPVVQESTLTVIDQEYTPPNAVFVYTYVLRPGAPSLHEFRPEHFSHVGRRLEDFEIDLSPLFRDDSLRRKEAKAATQIELDADSDEDDAGEFPDEADEE